MNLVAALCMAVASLGVSKSEKRTACKYMPYVVQQSAKHNVDPSLVVAMMFVESSFQKKVVSNKSACGLMQLIPKWNYVKIRGKKKFYTCKELFEPRLNIRLGVKALKKWIRITSSDGFSDADSLYRSVCAYNAGNRCRSKKRIKDPTKTRYVKKVLATQKKLHSAMGHKPFESKELLHCTVEVCPGDECPCSYGESNILYFNYE